MKKALYYDREIGEELIRFLQQARGNRAARAEQLGMHAMNLVRRRFVIDAAAKMNVRSYASPPVGDSPAFE